MGEMILALKAQGVSVLLSEQNTHFADWVSDRSYTLDRGVIASMSSEVRFASLTSGL
jgi:branched-chain amino acid transport system ATP-binding protein